VSSSSVTVLAGCVNMAELTEGQGRRHHRKVLSGSGLCMFVHTWHLLSAVRPCHTCLRRLRLWPSTF
jgi:hypothetical protein